MNTPVSADLWFSSRGDDGATRVRRAMTELWDDLGRSPTAGEVYALIKLREELELASTIEGL